MVEAYATGFPIRISTYGKPGSAPGDQDPVGFTNPWARAGTVINAAGQPSTGSSAQPSG